MAAQRKVGAELWKSKPPMLIADESDAVYAEDEAEKAARALQDFWDKKRTEEAKRMDIARRLKKKAEASDGYGNEKELRMVERRNRKDERKHKKKRKHTDKPRLRGLDRLTKEGVYIPDMEPGSESDEDIRRTIGHQDEVEVEKDVDILMLERNLKLAATPEEIEKVQRAKKGLDMHPRSVAERLMEDERVGVISWARAAEHGRQYRPLKSGVSYRNKSFKLATAWRRFDLISLTTSLYFRTVGFFFLLTSVCTVLALLPSALNIISFNLDTGAEYTGPLLLSLGSKGVDLTPIPFGLYSLFIMVVIIFTILWWRFDMETHIKTVDQENATASDYTSLIRNVDISSSGDLKKIKDFFLNFGDIHRILVCVNFLRIQKLEAEVKAVADLLERDEARLRLVTRFNANDPTVHDLRKYLSHMSESKLTESIEGLKKKKENAEKKMMAAMEEPPVSTGDLFVSFKYEAQNDSFLAECRRGKFHRIKNALMRAPDIEISRADEPDSVYYDALMTSGKEKLLRRVILYVLFGIALVLNYVVLATVEGTRGTIEEASGILGKTDADSAWARWSLSLAQIFIILLINVLFKESANISSRFAKVDSRTEQQVWVFRWITLGQCLNTIVMPFTVKIWSPLIHSDMTEWYAPGGYVEVMFYIAFWTSFIPDIGHILQLTFFCRYCIVSRVRSMRQKGTQPELNVLLRPPRLDYAARYANLFLIMTLCFTLGATLPIIWFVAGCGIFVNGSVDYYLAVKVMRRPMNTTHRLHTTMAVATSRAVALYVFFTVLFYLWQCVIVNPLGIEFSFAGGFFPYPSNFDVSIVKTVQWILFWAIVLVMATIYVIWSLIPWTRLLKPKSVHRKREVAYGVDRPYDAVGGIKQYELPIDTETYNRWIQISRESKPSYYDRFNKSEEPIKSKDPFKDSEGLSKAMVVKGVRGDMLSAREDDENAMKKAHEESFEPAAESVAPKKMQSAAVMKRKEKAAAVASMALDLEQGVMDADSKHEGTSSTGPVALVPTVMKQYGQGLGSRSKESKKQKQARLKRERTQLEAIQKEVMGLHFDSERTDHQQLDY